MSRKVELADDHAAMLDLLVVLCREVLDCWKDKIGTPDYDNDPSVKVAEYNALRVRLVILISRLIKNYEPLTGDDDSGIERILDEIDKEAVQEYHLWQIKDATEKTDPGTIPDN